MTATQPRPRIVSAGFWALLVGALLLMVGGLVAATLNFDTVRAATSYSISDEQLNDYVAFHRGASVGCVAAGLALAFLAGSTRTGDVRFRRATIGLGLALVVVVGLLAVFAAVHVLALLSLIPVIVGIVLLTRPDAAAWFDPIGQREEPGE